MNTTMQREISVNEIDTYHRDGVVLIKDMFDSEWIDVLKRGLTNNCENPTHRARTWDRDAEGRTMFWDSQAWQEVDEYQQFIFKSPAAEIAGKLLKARMPLVPVKKKNALAFVPGSHLNNEIFDQPNFGDLNPDGKTDVDQTNFSGIAEESIPDIDANPERYGVVSFDMEPGDCVAFNSRILHGGSGKLDGDTELKVFTSKWLGDDARIKFRECGMDPDHSAIMTEYGLKPGDRPGTKLYPKIWQQNKA